MHSERVSVHTQAPVPAPRPKVGKSAGQQHPKKAAHTKRRKSGADRDDVRHRPCYLWIAKSRGEIKTYSHAQTLAHTPTYRLQAFPRCPRPVGSRKSLLWKCKSRGRWDERCTAGGLFQSFLNHPPSLKSPHTHAHRQGSNGH